MFFKDPSLTTSNTTHSTLPQLIAMFRHQSACNTTQLIRRQRRPWWSDYQLEENYLPSSTKKTLLTQLVQKHRSNRDYIKRSNLNPSEASRAKIALRTPKDQLGSTYTFIQSSPVTDRPFQQLLGKRVYHAVGNAMTVRRREDQ